MSASNITASPTIALPTGPSQAELDTVIVERDMLMEDVADLKVQLEKVGSDCLKCCDYC